MQIKTSMRYHPTPVRMEWLLSKGQVIANGDEDVEKREHLCTVGWNVNWCSHYGKQFGGSSES